MTKEIEIIRELHAAELDEVAGGHVLINDLADGVSVTVTHIGDIVDGAANTGNTAVHDLNALLRSV